MTSKIDVRESKTDNIELVFAGENISLSVDKPLLEYGIDEDVKVSESTSRNLEEEQRCSCKGFND